MAQVYAHSLDSYTTQAAVFNHGSRVKRMSSNTIKDIVEAVREAIGCQGNRVSVVVTGEMIFTDAKKKEFTLLFPS